MKFWEVLKLKKSLVKDFMNLFPCLKVKGKVTPTNDSNKIQGFTLPSPRYLNKPSQPDLMELNAKGISIEVYGATARVFEPKF